MQDVIRKILDASFSLISVKPLGMIKAGDIIKEAGVSKGSFYHYFKDKYDCVSAAFIDAYFKGFYQENATFRQALIEQGKLLWSNHLVLKNVSVNDSFLLAFSAINDEYRKILRNHILNEQNKNDEIVIKAINYLSRTLSVTLYLWANDKISLEEARFLTLHFEDIVPACLKQYIL